MMMKIESMTYKEFSNKIRSVILPIGSIEQHGSHCCLGTDLIIANYFAKKISARTSISVMPYIAYGCSDIHKTYHGTISIRDDVFLNYLENILSSLISSGVQMIYIINGHGGNIRAIKKAVDLCRESTKCEFDVKIVNWWIEGRGLGLFAEDEYHHAGALETSVLMAINDKYVNVYEFQDSDVIEYNPFEVKKIDDITKIGSIGRVSSANSQRGEYFIQQVMEVILKKYFE